MPVLVDDCTEMLEVPAFVLVEVEVELAPVTLFAFVVVVAVEATLLAFSWPLVAFSSHVWHRR